MESGWPHITLLRKPPNREVIDKGIQPHIDLGTGRSISKDMGMEQEVGRKERRRGRQREGIEEGRKVRGWGSEEGGKGGGGG